MKSTKTLLIAALAASALLAGVSSLRAQDATNVPPAVQHGMKGRQDIAKALDLTDDQKPKVKAILKDSMDKRKALREDDTLTPEDKKDKAKIIQDDTNAKMKAVLTPEQFTKYQAMTKHARSAPAHTAAPPQ